jgi:hypothetical protein
MRTKMTLKLCPLLSILICVMSCGKKANESTSSDISGDIQEQEPSANLILELDTTNSRTKTYKLKRDGVFTLPDRLTIRNGHLPGRKVSIKLNLDAINHSIYTLKCEYVTSDFQPNQMDVETCYDDVGTEIGNYTTEVLPMHKGKLIQMELIGAYSPASAFAYFNVDWQ